MSDAEKTIKGYLFSFVTETGDEKFVFPSFGISRKQAKNNFYIQNHSQRLEPIKPYKMYSAVLSINEMEQEMSNDQYVGMSEDILVKAAQSCLSPDQYENFEALLTNDKDAHNRFAKAIKHELKSQNGFL